MTHSHKMTDSHMNTQGRRSQEKQKKMHHILDCAEKVFFAKGCETATVEDIAEKADLAKGTVYLYFTSKEEIYEALANRATERLLKLIEKNTIPSDTGFDKFESIFASFIEFYEHNKKHFQMMRNFHLYIAQRPELQKDHHAKLCEKQEQVIQKLSKALQEGMNDGSIKKTIQPPSVAIITLMGSMMMIKLSMIPQLMQNSQPGEDPIGLTKYFFSLIKDSIEEKNN